MFWIADIFVGRIPEQNLQRYDNTVREDWAESFARAFLQGGCGDPRPLSRYQGLLARRKLTRQLGRLSEHQLQDIGFARIFVAATGSCNWFLFQKQTDGKRSLTDIPYRPEWGVTRGQPELSDNHWKRAA